MRFKFRLDHFVENAFSDVFHIKLSLFYMLLHGLGLESWLWEQEVPGLILVCVKLKSYVDLHSFYGFLLHVLAIFKICLSS